MKTKMSGVWSVALLLLLVGCADRQTSLSEGDIRGIRQSVDSVTHAFARAQRELDAERVISFISPELYMYIDGSRVGYDSVVAQIRRTFGGLSSFETEFTNVEVVVLGRDGAIASLTFRDVITDTAGFVTTGRGPTTLGWARRNGEWLIVYADADHYPDPAP